MKYFDNIDKSAFRKGEYVGYADGVWLIRKTNSSYGNWIAHFRDDPKVTPIYGFKLEDLSRKLHEYAARKKNPRRRKKNPAPRKHDAAVEAAAKLQSDFSGHEPGNVDTVKVPDNKVFTPVGKLAGVLYDTTRDGKREKYIHKFRSKSRPLLLVSHDGTELRIAGGRFRFTEAGIEDR